MTITPLPPIPTLPPESMSLGADPRLLRDELKYLIMLYATMSPRSLQTTIGPSEIGTPCTRRLAFMVTQGRPSGGPSSASWRSSVGTAVHSYLANVFAEHNLETHEAAGYSRFLIESTVDVGEIGGVSVQGSSDLYDRVTATVVDWKIVGPATIKSAKANGPAPRYQTQVQLYGRGFTRRGLPVERVSIMFLPSSGDIRDAYMWSTDYDESVAVAALTRANATLHAVEATGPAVMIPLLPTADDYCTSCPWFVPQAREASGIACPGHNRKAVGPLPSGDDVLGAA